MVKITVQKAADTERLAERASLVDELFELTAWAESPEVKDRIKRLAEVKTALTADANESWNDRSVARTLDGDLAVVTVGAASCKREVTDPKKVQEIVGDEAFYGGIKVPLEFVDKYLNPEEQKLCVSEEYTGPRKIKVAPRHG